MKQKDLAEEYALKEYVRVNGESDLIFEDNKCFTFDDIKAAFNAGRESVVEDATELDWEDIDVYGGKARYINVCKAQKPLEEYMIQKWFCPNDIELHCNHFVKKGFKTIEDAKQAANEHYKQYIKQTLGL